MQISTKKQFLDLYIAGALGNRFEVWTDYKLAIKSGIHEVGFREINPSGGGGKFVIVPNNEIEKTAIEWIREGRNYYLNGADLNDNSRTIQGELWYNYDGWHGFIGPCNGYRMREAMALGLLKPSKGMVTRDLMNRYMDINTRQDIDDILTLYPDAVIEFTCYSVEVGILNCRNTIIWEVRNY